ncbi:MAG: hypothetical protein F4X65_11485 [Chloroflexi bacterium]|nr:hypothetical protein [Chloroflexota bacterium]
MTRDSSERFELAQGYRETAQTGALARYWKRRWEKSEEMAAWLSPASLPSLSEEQSLALYRASGCRNHREFSANPPEEVNDTLDFLLYDTITLEARFNECVSDAGAYKLAGAGKEFISYLLCLRQPGLLAVWNPAAERALRRLGRYPKGLARGHWGLRYMDLLEATHGLRPEYGLADFREVDEFCYFVDRRARADKAQKDIESSGRERQSQPEGRVT